MKIFLFFILIFYLGCAQEKWIQAERTLVKLVDVDEFYRYGGEDGCLLFWEDQRTMVKYTQFVKQVDCGRYTIGILENILIRK